MKYLQILILVLTCQFAGATNYYVSTSGNDNSNGMSFETAFRSIKKAVEMVNPGDTVNVEEGDYGEWLEINKSGEKLKWITFKSSKKWGAKLFRIHINANYIVVDGFECSNDSSTINGFGFGAGQGRHHIVIRNNYAHHCGSNGIQSYDADYITIENNLSHNNAYLFELCGSGITCYGGLNFDNAFVDRIIIRGNISHSNENGPTTKRTDGNGFIIDNLSNSQEYHLPSIINKPFNGKILVENNLAYNNGGRGMYIMSSKNATFRNNTSYQNSRQNSGGELVCFDATNITWINNIGYSSPKSGNYGICDDGNWGSNSNIQWINNLTFNGTTGEPSVRLNKTTTKAIDNTNKLGVDPMFVNPAMDGTGNFSLKTGSPAINAGTIIYGVATTDIDSTVRVQDGMVDLGSFETAGTTVALTGIALNLTSAPLAITGVLQLAESLIPADASYKAVNWTSSNNSIATVSQNGLVTGVSLGQATITVTARDGNKTAVCEITVTNDASVNVTQVKINLATSTLEVGSNLQLEATVEPSFASNIVLWTSDNPTVATVSANGLITAVTAGKATVSATSEDGKITATNVVTVKEVAVKGVSVSQTTAVITIGATKQLTETILPANAKNKTVSWKSSNTAVATVSANGLVTGVATGKATITVTTQDGNKTSRCTITVSSNKITSYEAEDGTSGGGGSLQSAGNASGGKLIGALNSEGAFTQIANVDGGIGSLVSLTIRYANGYSDNRSLSLYVNGVWVKQLVFKTTGGWNSFAEITTDVPLISGTGNTIKLQRDATDVAAADIDKYTITEIPLSVVAPLESGSAFTVYPNPVTNGSFNLKFDPVDTNSDNQLSIVDVQGKLFYSKVLANESELSIVTANLLKSGLYFIKLQSGNKIAMQKLMVK